MTWDLPKPEYRRYRRNPLVAVISQLRFHSVLKIERDHVGYQDRVRPTFPRFSVRDIQDVEVNLNGAQVNRRKELNFATLDQRKNITLSTTSMSLTSRQHQSRSGFGNAMRVGLDALLAEYGPVVATRFGLRYINRVSRKQISEDLGEDVDWKDLIHDDFLRIPKGLSDLEGTHYVMEARSTMDRGALTLRYGMIRDNNTGEVHFRLDTDRYVTEEFDAAKALDLLKGFSDDVYAVFRAAAAPGLEKWMEPQGDSDA